MRALIQRVSHASVNVDDKQISAIGHGLLLLLGIHRSDNASHISRIAQKILNLRIFADENGKMNRSLLDIQGELLVVSQFTLYGNTNGGRRPDFLDAAPPDQARLLYEQFLDALRPHIKLQTGLFGAYMQISLINDGPVTFLIE